MKKNTCSCSLREDFNKKSLSYLLIYLFCLWLGVVQNFADTTLVLLIISLTYIIFKIVFYICFFVKEKAQSKKEDEKIKMRKKQEFEKMFGTLVSPCSFESEKVEVLEKIIRREEFHNSHQDLVYQFIKEIKDPIAKNKLKDLFLSKKLERNLEEIESYYFITKDFQK